MRCCGLAQPAQADARFCDLLVSGDDMAGGASSGAQPVQADSRFCGLLVSGDDMAGGVSSGLSSQLRPMPAFALCW
ncbi:hypothetical protein AMS64_07635 [Aeromonas veronii]|nr:hypothetical protein AMS64_07635 [Aeromonas veronii]